MELSPDSLQLLRVTTFDEIRSIICQKHSKQRLVSTKKKKKKRKSVIGGLARKNKERIKRLSEYI